MRTPYMPVLLPLKEVAWGEFVSSIAKANATLARYDGYLKGIPNSRVLLSPLSTQEAVLSSKIEGTQATLEEVLKFEADPKTPTDRYEDIKEILNYRKATSFAESELQKSPLCLNLVKRLHRILLAGVRGHSRHRGEFRKIQNWIGKPNTSIERAIYIPPAPEHLLELLSNWENYIHYDEKDRLVQLAVIHAQFELIHPFIDGNGRIGRILIPLFLSYKEVLSGPTFYISAAIEETRDEYYTRLLGISQHSDWSGWISYFLKVITEQAQKNSQQAKDIMDLYNVMKDKIANLTRSRFSIQALDFLFNSPLFSGTQFITASKIPKVSATRILKSLRDGGVIKLIKPGRGRKPALYIFPQLVKIAQS